MQEIHLFYCPPGQVVSSTFTCLLGGSSTPESVLSSFAGALRFLGVVLPFSPSSFLPRGFFVAFAGVDLSTGASSLLSASFSKQTLVRCHAENFFLLTFHVSTALLLLFLNACTFALDHLLDRVEVASLWEVVKLLPLWVGTERVEDVE